MKKLKKIIAAVMTSAMVFGMSFATFAAETPSFDIKASAVEGSNKATLDVTSANVELNGSTIDVFYDTEVFENPVVDRSKLDAAGLNSTIVNANVAGRVRVVMGGAVADVVSLADVLTITVDVKAGVETAALKEALAKVSLQPVTVYNTEAKMTVSNGNACDENGKETTTPVEPIVIGEEKVEIVQPSETPSEAPSETPSEAPSETPSEAPSETPKTEVPSTQEPGTTTTAPVNTQKPATTTVPGQSPKTADTASVVLPVVALCGAAAVIIVVSKKRAEEN